jgi:hypothetical protein
MKETRRVNQVKFFDPFPWCPEEKEDRNTGEKTIILIL